MRFSSLALLLSATLAVAADVSDADKRIVQTIQRLSSFDYSKASPRTQEATQRYLDATAGSAEYFTLVEKYQITAQAGSLLKLATEQAGNPKAAESVKILLKLGQEETIRKTLATLGPEAAGALLESIANAGSQEAVVLALSTITDPATATAVRLRAVKALGLGASGQKALLGAARAKNLPDDIREAAGTALTASTDEAIRTEAATLFQISAKKPLPPVAELVQRTGDATRGQTVFMTYCFTCHQVNGTGIDFGPALSEIGSKLAREAIYESILNPSAGISFGFDGFEVKTRAGDTFIGMVASETAEELDLKVPGGVIQKTAKANVLSKTKLGVSLMTPGLDSIMEENQLVDLVEYLSGLKKKD